jgi:hypothetical protein
MDSFMNMVQVTRTRMRFLWNLPACLDYVTKAMHPADPLASFFWDPQGQAEEPRRRLSQRDLGWCT